MVENIKLMITVTYIEAVAPEVFPHTIRKNDPLTLMNSLEGELVLCMTVVYFVTYTSTDCIEIFVLFSW